MHRYGYSFIKGSGADYKFSFIIEVIFFAGAFCVPLLLMSNPGNGDILIHGFLLLMFVYGLFAILAEMLPKTSLYLSLLLITGLFVTEIFDTVKYGFDHKFDSALFFNIGIQTLYFSLIAIVTIYLIRKEITLSKIPK